jgi:hypothetical protein
MIPIIYEGGKSDQQRLLPITLTARYGFNTNVTFTEAFKDMYALTAVNPSILANSHYVR